VTREHLVIASEAKQSSRAAEKILDRFVARSAPRDDGSGGTLRDRMQHRTWWCAADPISMRSKGMGPNWRSYCQLGQDDEPVNS